MNSARGLWGQRRKLERSKKDALFYRRLDWWEDGIIMDRIPILRSSGASGFIVSRLKRQCFVEGVIRLYEKFGVDDAGDPIAWTGFEYMHAKTTWSVGECQEIMDALRQDGHLYSWWGRQGFMLHSPVFKRGDIPLADFIDMAGQNAPRIQPGENLFSFLKNQRAKINGLEPPSSATGTIDKKEREPVYVAPGGPAPAPAADGAQALDVGQQYDRLIATIAASKRVSRRKNPTG